MFSLHVYELTVFSGDVGVGRVVTHRRDKRLTSDRQVTNHHFSNLWDIL